MGLAQLVWFVFSAGGVIVAFGGLVALLLAFPASRRVRRSTVLVAGFYLLASVYVVPEALGRLLAADYRPLRPEDLPSGNTTIVVLGAGSRTVRDWDGHRFFSPDPHAASRALEAARIFRFSSSAAVISSGGLLTPDAPGTPTGEAMAVALRQMGVPGDHLQVETLSRNTRDEALIIARMLRERPASTVVLVTTDVHMRRSVGAFAAAGLRVVPAIAQAPDADLPRRRRWLPSDDGLGYSGLVAHEVLGILYYAVRGWFAF